MIIAPSAERPPPSNKTPASLIWTPPVSSIETALRATVLFATLLGVAALAILLAAPRTIMRAATPVAMLYQDRSQNRVLAQLTQGVDQLTQDDDDDSAADTNAEKGASPEQIEKYVAVYRAMQRDHNLTVEQATAAQGLTVGAFRDLERLIESDDLARDDARNALARPAQAAASAATPATKR